MRGDTIEPATWGVAEDCARRRFAGWALTDGGRMIWTAWRQTYTRARCELPRKARRAGIVLRWWDGATTPGPVEAAAG
jgi:hypothetical protein